MGCAFSRCAKAPAPEPLRTTQPSTTTTNPPYQDRRTPTCPEQSEANVRAMNSWAMKIRSPPTAYEFGFAAANYPSVPRIKKDRNHPKQLYAHECYQAPLCR